MQTPTNWSEFFYLYQNYNKIEQKPKLYKIIENQLLRDDKYNVEEHRQKIKQLKFLKEQEKQIKQQQLLAELVKNGKIQNKIPPKPKQPVEPEQDDCCGQGCAVCVWDLYYDKLDQYEEDLQKWESKYGSVSTNNTEGFNQTALQGNERIMQYIGGGGMELENN